MMTESNRLPGLTDAMKERLTVLIDRHYIRDRNALIREAVKFANKQFNPKADEWSQCFSRKMDRLWREFQNNGEGKNGTKDGIRTT